MRLLPGWKELLAQAEKVKESQPDTAVYPLSPAYHCQQTNHVDSQMEANRMVQLAEQLQLSHIGFDTEFRYSRPALAIVKGKPIFDVRSIQPLLMSLSFVEDSLAKQAESDLYTFVVDLRKPELLPPVRRIFSLPVTFAAHSGKNELFCLQQLDIHEPRQYWDTFIHEKALKMGRDHHRYRLAESRDEPEEIRAKSESRRNEEFGCSLIQTCLRYGISYAMETVKGRLQKSFLQHPAEAPFTEEQIQYAAEDAIAVARLYPRQVLQATQTGILNHLITIEMPWALTNARIEWTGVRIDQSKQQRVLQACEAHLSKLEKELEYYGIRNVQSHPQLREFFESQGLLELFRCRGKHSFDKDQLELFENRHPAIRLIRVARQIRQLKSNPLLSRKLIGVDGRVHPYHVQLGAETGRQTCRNPNILGIGRTLRPLLVPDPGYGIGEVDYSQIEIGIAGAVYLDQKLIEKFNSGDVYSSMARDFYVSKLPPEDLHLPGSEFKRKYPGLRDRMKPCALGIIYGLTPRGLAQQLDISEAEASRVLNDFLDMFPDLQKAKRHTSEIGLIRRYASTITGLRRYCGGRRNWLSSWERNWLANHPVQGTAAAIFKVAGNRLRSAYRQFGARIIIPLHDAFIFEARLAVLEQVASTTERIMIETVEEFFPRLEPHVEVNIAQPSCWNKDGDAESLDRWLEDPFATAGGVRSTDD